MPSAEMCNGISDDCDDDIDEDTCDFPNTQATCEPGGCVVSECDTGFLDCSEGLGCETASDRNNCGACGVMCGATEGCEAGVCVEHTLDWWWTVDGASVLISSGLDQRYLLTTPTSSAVIMRPSTGGLVDYSGQSNPYSFLVATDESGTLLWQVSIDAESLEIAAITSIDGADGVYIAGSFRGTLRAGRVQPADLLDSAGTNRDGFVLRVDAAGNVESVAQLTDPPSSDTSQSIADSAVSPDGRVFVIGSSMGDLATRVGGVAVLIGGNSGFLHRVGGGVVSTPDAPWESVTTDDESVYVAARLEDTVTLGGIEFSRGDNFHPLIASYDRDLEIQWAQAPLDSESGSGEDWPLQIHAGNGSVVVSHAFSEIHSIGGEPIDVGGYLVSLSAADGRVEWGRTLGIEPFALGSGRGQVYFAGFGSGTIDLGGGSLGAAVGGDALFGALDNSSGNYAFARRFGGLNQDEASQVEPTGTGTMVSGSWSGVMNVDGVMFEAHDSRETFVFHFSTED